MTDNLQWTIGDVTVTRIVESVAQIPPGGLLPSATAEVVESHSSWLRPHFVDDDGNLVLSIHAFGGCGRRPPDDHRHVHRQRPPDPGDGGAQPPDAVPGRPRGRRLPA